MADSPTIVGIGEVLWDMLPTGRQLGGAPANFAYHARALGANGVPVSRVGDDDLGREILRRLASLGLDTRYVSTDRAHPTGRVDVRLDSAGVPDYVIHQPVAWDFIPADAPSLELASRADAVCFGTLAQRSPVSRASIRAFLRATRPQCLRVFDINLRQSYFDRGLVRDQLGLADVLKLNDAELSVVARLLEIEADAATVVRRLLRDYNLRVVALTRGPAGSALYTPDRTSDHPGLPPPKIVDTVGAGDAFTAALVLGLLKGHDLDRINDFANRLASYVCSQPGATPEIPSEMVRSWNA
jgi:fructokinase